MKLPLSVVVIAHNEEHRIGNCLSSVQWADDLLVVIDPQTTDRTAEVAQAQGARVLVEAWRGFGPQKSFATSMAKHDWVLSLDADEEASPGLSAEIQSSFSTLDPEIAYRIPRSSFHLGRWIRFGGWTPDYQTRLFNRKHAGWNQEMIHEKIEASQFRPLKHTLLHFLFENLADQIDTNNRYSGLLAEKDFQQGKRFSLLKLIFKPWVKFVETYVWKMGFRDGIAGFIIAVGAAYSIFLRQAKIWELQCRGKGNS